MDEEMMLAAIADFLRQHGMQNVEHCPGGVYFKHPNDGRLYAASVNIVEVAEES